MSQKMYVGERFGKDAVFVEPGHRLLEPRFEQLRKWDEGFAWGRYFDPKTAHLPIPRTLRPIHPGALQLAHAILADHFGNLELARKAYMRFAYRTIADQDGDRPFVLTVEQVAAAYAAIKEAEADPLVAIAKQRADREMPTPVTEGGAGIVWDAYEEPRVNDPNDGKRQ